MFEPVDDDLPADPQHRGDPDLRDQRQHDRHRRDEPAADLLQRSTGAAGEREADIVHLHDQRDDAIDADGDRHRDHRQRDRLIDQRLIGKRGERDRHDLRRKDQIGADRARHLALLQLLRVGGDHLGRVVRRTGQRLDHLLGRFEAQEGAAGHQDRGDRPGRERREQQRRREEEDQLVAERAERDLADDRQLACRGEADDVARGDRGIVDHHPRRLGAGTPGGAGHVVEAGSGEFRECSDIVKQRN